MDKIRETFNLIKNSEEFGKGSCSTIDECWTDGELMQNIESYFKVFPEETPQDYFNFQLDLEAERNSRDLFWI